MTPLDLDRRNINVDMAKHFLTPKEESFEHKKLQELQKYFWDVDRCRWSPEDPDILEFLYDYRLGGEMLERVSTFCGNQGNNFHITVWKEHLLLQWRVR